MKTLGIIIMVLLLVGCTTMTSTKTVTFEKDSINLHPFPWPTKETVNEAGEVSVEFILPDGTFQTVEGMPHMGNMVVIANQNDGTDQQGAKTDAKASASANVTSPNANATTGPISDDPPPTE